MEPITKVIFRKWKSNGDIIAFFPDLKDGPYILSYEHIGQHGNASYPHPQTISVSPEEYKNLFNELTQVGYNLKIIKRITRK